MALTPRENWLESVRFGSPEYVPRAEEGIVWSLALEGNFRQENWTDGWGVDWRVGIEGTVPFPKGNPLPDLSRVGDYRFPDPGSLVLTERRQTELLRVDRNRHVVLGFLTYMLFERAWAITGMDELLIAMHTHPDETHALLHGIAKYTRSVFARYLDLGVEGVGGSEDLGTQRALFISPDTFREFLLPEYAFMFGDALAAGKMVFFHSCGCVDAVAADLAQVGVTILNPVQARANDLRRLKRDTLGRTALDGGIDTAVLAQGTPDDVRREARRVLELLAPGGGYVCGPDQAIPGIPPENMAALWETVRAEGCY